MKWNWGTGIALFYLIFMASLIFQVVKSTKYDHSLVVDDYYEKDLQYQSHFDKIQNQQQLAEALEIGYDKESAMVKVKFPEGETTGTILMFRPATSKDDRLVTIELGEEHTQLIGTEGLAKGLWRVKVNWQSEGIDYYQEDSVVL